MKRDPNNGQKITKHIKVGDVLFWGYPQRNGIVTKLKDGMSFEVLESQTQRAHIVTIHSITNKISH